MYEINFNKIFSLIIKKKSLHIFLATSYFFDLIIKWINIVEAYLENLLSDNNLPIFIKLLLGIEVFKLIRFDLLY